MKCYCLLSLLLCLTVPACFTQVNSQHSGKTTCPQNQVPCDSSDCIPKENWCDEEIDCGDGSDEKYCRRKRWFVFASVNDCNEKHFECKDGPCVPLETRCDGFKNCKDNSDETDCNKVEDEEFVSEEATIELTLSTSSDDVFNNDNDFDINNFVSSPEITESAVTTSSSNYVALIVPDSRTSTESSDRQYSESTNLHITGVRYNRVKNVNPWNMYQYPGSHSPSYHDTRVGETTNHPKNSDMGDHNSVEKTTIDFINSQYDREENIRSGSSNGPVSSTTQPFIPDNHYINDQTAREGHDRSRYPNDEFSTFSSSISPPTVQPSLSDSFYTTSEHREEDYDTTLHLKEEFSTFPSLAFSSTIQPSPSDDFYTTSQYDGDEHDRSIHLNEEFTTSLSCTFLPTVKSPNLEISCNDGLHEDELNVKSGDSDATLTKLSDRILPSTIQPSVYNSDTNSQHDSEGNSIPWYRRRTSISSADSPAEHLSPAEHDYSNAEDRIQSSVNQKINNNNYNKSFNFNTNYTLKFSKAFEDNVQRAKDWILNQRNTSYGWEEDTPRALIALSLINNSFLLNFTENELMKKSLVTRFGVKVLLMRNNPWILTNSKLATYINALLATCQDPRKFFNNDLTKDLRNRTTYFGPNVDPFAYLTLCLTGTPVELQELNALVYLLQTTDSDERTKDMKILVTTVLACFQHQDLYKTYLEPAVKDAFKKLLDTRLSDYSFGSIYSTALAAQALMSVNTNEWHDAKKTIDFLIKHQLPDGSFGDMLATYLILPALSGRSLLHLRNTYCEPVYEPDVTSTTTPEPDGPKIGIFYTIRVGFPETSSISIFLEIPEGYNFLYALKKAEKLNSQFRFLYKELDSGSIDVHTIADIPNDTERGFRWKLYVADGASEGSTINLKDWYTGDVAELIPEDQQELIYWYLPLL